jgi:tyrosinase
MPHAPVWEADGGFGGDGASDAPTTVGDGRCVRDGPFSHFEAPYYGDQAHPHCLSRGFASRDELLRIGEPISPDALEALSRSSASFEDFAADLEHRAHTFMRDGVRGDFRAYTGPYGMVSSPVPRIVSL